MVRAAWEKFRAWWSTKFVPRATFVAKEWWDDIDENPRPHFVSMVVGMVILTALKVAVFLVA